MKEKFQQYVPEPTEMEKILARRKDPKERERVITFYDILIQNINDELDGVLQTENNETVNGLMDQMINDLKSKGQYGPYQYMSEKQRRTDLLIMLHDRVFSRREKVATIRGHPEEVEFNRGIVSGQEARRGLG